MNLNSRQKKLYEYLLDMSATNRYISKEEISTALDELYPRGIEIANEHNSTAYNLIRKDVRAINSSDSEKIIVSSKKGYKVGTENETRKFIDKRFKRDLRSLKVNWNLKRKVANNGQVQMNPDSDDLFKEIRTFLEE